MMNGGSAIDNEESIQEAVRSSHESDHSYISRIVAEILYHAAHNTNYDDRREKVREILRPWLGYRPQFQDADERGNTRDKPGPSEGYGISFGLDNAFVTEQTQWNNESPGYRHSNLSPAPPRNPSIDSEEWRKRNIHPLLSDSTYMPEATMFYATSTGGPAARKLFGQLRGARSHIKIRIDQGQGGFMVPLKIKFVTAVDASFVFVKEEKRWWDFSGKWKGKKYRKLQ
jgi:hypothetical protein